MPTSVRFMGLALGRMDPPAGGYALVEPPTGAGVLVEPPTGGGVLVETPAGGGVEPTGAMPTSVRFIETPALGGGVEPAVAGGTETTLGGGVEPGLGGRTLVDPSGGGVLLVEVVGRGGVEAPGATPMSVFFIEAAVGDVAGGDGRGGTDELGRNAAPQVLHSAVSGLAGDPHRGHEIILADYFSCSENAMA